MNTQTRWVPFSVLNATTHSPTTRLIWLMLGRHSDTGLLKLSGLDMKTVAAARARLAEAPLAPWYVRPHPSCAEIPWQLLTSGDLSAGARLLYGQLQGVPGFEHQSGSFTYEALSRLTGRSDDTLRAAVAELAAAGWLVLTQANRKRPLQFKLRNPVSAQLRARISRIRRKVKSAQHKGETLLREFLNLLIALDDHEENAAPDLLINPFTSELMELDRYYPTAFICKARGIELVVIHPEDLTLKGIGQKLPRRLPRRDMEELQPLVAALEELAAEYRERTAEERARKGRA